MKCKILNSQMTPLIQIHIEVKKKKVTHLKGDWQSGRVGHTHTHAAVLRGRTYCKQLAAPGRRQQKNPKTNHKP